MSLFTRVGLTIFLVYHLAAVVLLPNPGSILARAFAPILNPYAATLAINSPWRFFAPNPGRHRYIEVELTKPDGDTETFFWPPRERDDILTENYNRRTNHSIMTTSTVERLHKYFAPWICRRFPDAESFSMRPVVIDIPSIEKAGIIDKKFAELEARVDFPPQRFDCERSHQ